MDVFRNMDVISSALTAERTRLNAISSNVANANSTQGVNGGPYRRKDVVLESAPHQQSFGEILSESQQDHTEVRVAEIREDQNVGRMIYKPDDKNANAEGYVEMPNVNPVEEMANMISADRAFQANVNLFQTTKTMALKALEIGK